MIAEIQYIQVRFGMMKNNDKLNLRKGEITNVFKKNRNARI